MQLDLFDVLYEDFKFDKDKPVRLVEMFAGIGTQRLGFEKAGIDVNVIGIIEVDKYALLSYASMHCDYHIWREDFFDGNYVSFNEMVYTLQRKNVGYNFATGKHSITKNTNIEVVRDFWLADYLSNNFGDISKVSGSDLPKDIDMLTYSFPCTDLSKAGKQKGLSDTRSGLVYQVFRIVEELKEVNNKPKTLLMENVVDLVQKKFIKEFHEMQFEVEEFGYQNYTFIMNAKDYGVAQNRNRVFMLSVPSEMNYVEPKPFKLEKRLKDYLEHSVDESYFLNDKQNIYIFGNAINKELKDHYDREKAILSPLISQTITTKMDRRVGDTTYLVEGYDNLTVKEYLMIKENTKKGYDKAYEGDGVYINRPHQKRGVVQSGMIQTLKTSGNDVGVVDKGLRIRKLTPLECWRLMGIDDEYFYKAQQVTSNAQLYKQAGNAIVVDVFANIVKSLV